MKENIINFNENFHPEFDGYLGEEDKGIWISFIISKQESKGHFLRLLNELKEKYDWIKIPTPSARMALIALRQGFELKKEYFPPPFDEWGEILYWRRD